MDNQRELSQEEINTMTNTKETGKAVGDYCEMLEGLLKALEDLKYIEGICDRGKYTQEGTIRERILGYVKDLEAQVAVWRPIETAPTDGSYIMLGNKNGSWVGRYNPVYQSGYRPKNPWQSMMLNHDHMRVRKLIPTHWMPMPSAPSLSEGGDRNHQ